MKKPQRNPMMEILPSIFQILKLNVSYILVLKIFDLLDVKIKSSDGNMIPVTIYQYLSWFGVENSWLIYDDDDDRLWVKIKDYAFAPNKTYIDRCVDRLDPKNPIELLKAITNVKVYTDQVGITMVGLQIPSQFKYDIDMIRRSCYSNLSENYIKKCYGRSRYLFNDRSIATVISEFNLGKRVATLDAEFKDVMQVRLGHNLDGKELLKKFMTNNETISREIFKEHANTNRHP